jgi:hypothetical protein
MKRLIVSLIALLTIASAGYGRTLRGVDEKVNDIRKGRNNNNQIQDLRVSDDATIGGDLDAVGTVSGTIGFSLDTAASVSLTADNVDATGMKGQVHINDDADVITYALPGAVAGLVFYIVNSDVGASNVITIDPLSGDRFVHEGLLMAADENLVSNGAGSACMIVGLDATRWMVIELNGDFNEASP